MSRPKSALDWKLWLARADCYSGRTWKDILRDIMAEIKAEGDFLPGTVAERQACKYLAKTGALEPNGCLGYRAAKKVHT